MTIQFLGAAGGVTGSSYLVTLANNKKILIDCGMFQGEDDIKNINALPFSFDPQTLLAVFVTHAHLDHCGRLPLLIREGFAGKIYTTAPTKEITHLSLLDAATLVQKHTKKSLFTKEEAEKVYQHLEAIEYDTKGTVGEVSFVFRNAGHILGSASIEIDSTDGVFVFSGDLGNTPEDLIQPTQYIDKADFVIMESTYGDKVHPQEDPKEVIGKEVEAIEKSGGVLLIPAFSIERTQEVIHLIGHLKKDKKISDTLPVYVDSPLAITVTDVFKKFPDLYNAELAKDQHPFDYSSLLQTKSSDASKAIIDAKNPKIIIAGSGMMSGGRIMHHLSNYISLPSTRLLIVGYQAIGTIGREILDGVTHISLYQQDLPVAATLTHIESLSSHADQPKLLTWLTHIQGVKKVFLTHGDDPQRAALAEMIKKELGLEVILPVKDEVQSI